MTNPCHGAPFRRLTPEAICQRLRGRRLVIVAPHPDDEALGCGGLIAHAVRCSVPLGIVALTDGGASHPRSIRWPPARLEALRAGEMRRALARLGAGGAAIRRLRWEDGNVERDANVTRLRRELGALRAGAVLVTARKDSHPDHQAAARLVQITCRELKLKMIEYTVWSRLNDAETKPMWYHRRKAWAVAAHRSQIGAYISDSPDDFCLGPATLTALIARPERFMGSR